MRRSETPMPPPAEAPAVVDTAEIDRKQLEALRQVRRAENRLRALQAEASIIRGD
jgi:hypothetical protein